VRRNETGSNRFEFGSNQLIGLEPKRNRPSQLNRLEPKPPAAAPDRAFRRLRPRRPSAMAPTAPPRREESNGGSHSRRRGPYAADELELGGGWRSSSPATTERRRSELWGSVNSPGRGGCSGSVRWSAAQRRRRSNTRRRAAERRRQCAGAAKRAAMQRADGGEDEGNSMRGRKRGESV
jgi:hypothetical protein